MKKLFFCALYFLFLNTCAVPASARDTKNFVQPFILADYNSGTLITNAGSLSGGDEQGPGTAYTALVSDDPFAKGNSGYSLKIDYDVSKMGEFSFYWMKLGKEISGRSDTTASADLSRYSYLSFWLRGGAGGEKMKIELHQDLSGDGVFVFGRDIASEVYVSSYIPGGEVKAEWQKVVIPLKDFKTIKDWKKMLELVFVFENRAGDTKGTVYIDDIIFGYRPEIVHSLKAIKPPIASSFRVNGTSSRACSTFNGSNLLEIKAESIRENPFLESVRFEYSVDKGSTWRTIGTIYDVSENHYKLNWHADNSKELLRYQIRAVASDIWGKDKATPVLVDCPVKPITDDEFLNLVESKAFEFFREHQSPKTGLFADTSGGGDASIASTGFGLTALCVGAERGWIHKDEARRRAILVLDAFLPDAEGNTLAEGKYGFFYHFLNMNTGKRAGKSEISTVDTAILVCGAITAGEYFGGVVKEKARKIYGNVEWERFLCLDKGPWYGTFSMGWSPERGMLSSYWDYYTDEAILVSLLAAGSPSKPVDPGVFYAWARNKDAYGNGKPFIYSWHGALFSYQYASVWFDFREITDKQDINWFQNSTDATLANRQFCIDNADNSKTYGPNTWGITSMSRPSAYTMHFGITPNGSGEALNDGTISPTGPAGSIVFTPYLSISALKYMYLTYPKLWGQYGLKDSFNLDTNWYSSVYYGIGEAMYLLPVENFRSGFIWKNFMKNEDIREALKRTGFTKKKRR